MPNLETINDNRPVSYVQSHRRPYDESNYFNPSQKNSVISRNNLNSVSSARNRVGTTVQTTKPPLDPVEQSTEALKKTKYNPVIRYSLHLVPKAYN